MKKLSEFTSGNYLVRHYLKCATSGLLLSDATPHFEVISVTNYTKLALWFPSMEAAKQAQKVMSSLYGSFDWQPVAAA